jgi:flagellar protein FliS
VWSEGLLNLTNPTNKIIGGLNEQSNQNKVELKFTYINKAIAIFDELRNVLDFDGGEVAYYLDGLYLYQIETLFSAGIDDNINAVNQVMKVTQGLIDAWKEETAL